MRVALALAIITAGLGTVQAEKLAPRPEPKAAQALLGAIARQDVVAFGRLVSTELEIQHVWFADRACQTRFWSGRVAGSDHRALLACLAALDLKAAGDDELVAAPGTRVRLELDGGVVRRLLTPNSRMRITVPQVTREVLRGHLKAGDTTMAPEGDELDQLANGTGVAFVQFEVCVSPSGALETVDVLRTSESSPRYTAAVTAALRTWSFAPFTVRGKAVQVCGVETLAYPQDRWMARPEADREPPAFAPPPPPPPPPPPSGVPQNVSPMAIEAARIAGSKMIIPDDQTKVDLFRAHKDRIVGSFKLCVTTTGEIAAVHRLKSTGFDAYDQKIMATIRNTWRYRPFMVNGEIKPVCTAVTFIYSQPIDAPAPPAPRREPKTPPAAPPEHPM